MRVKGFVVEVIKGIALLTFALLLTLFKRIIR